MAHGNMTDPDGWEILTAHDLLNHAEELMRERENKPYDEWKETETFFHRPSMTIQVYTGRDHYGVELKHCRNSAEMLDMVFQVNGKDWCTGPILKGFMACLDQACHSVFKSDPQAVFCPWGQDRNAGWGQAG